MKRNTQNQSSKPNNDSYTLTPSQIMSLVTSTIIGVGVLTLPRSVTEATHQSGWISVILGGFVSMFVIWIIMQLNKRFPKSDMISMGQQILGSPTHPWIGKILVAPIIFIFVLYWFTTTAGVARTFGEVVVTAVLVRTPLEVVVGSMLLVAYILVLYDLEVMARVNEALLPIIIIPVLFIALLSFQSADFMRLLPIISVDWKAIFNGALVGSFAYLGYEVLVAYFGHFPKDQSSSLKSAMYGIAVPMLVYTLIVISGISVFGFEELQQLMWPTLELVKTTEMPGLILERLESAFLGVWVAAVFTTTANLYFSACHIVKKLFSWKSQRLFATFMLPILYYMAMWPENVHDLFRYLEYASYLGLGIGVSGPILLLFVCVMRKHEKKPQEGGKDTHGRDTNPS